jgi:hypothetical protein
VDEEAAIAPPIPEYSPAVSIVVIVSDLRGRDLSVRVLELALPPLQVGFDRAALAGAEEVHTTLGTGLVAGSGRDSIGRSPHRAGSLVGPSVGRGPAYSRCGFGEHARGQQKE